LKACLVAKGYTQTYNIDNSQTFSPVAKIYFVRVLISLVANLDWPLFQFDVKNYFLHEEVLYGATTWICCSREHRFVWSQAIPEGMVWKILYGNFGVWSP